MLQAVPRAVPSMPERRWRTSRVGHSHSTNTQVMHTSCAHIQTRMRCPALNPSSWTGVSHWAERGAASGCARLESGAHDVGERRADLAAGRRRAHGAHSLRGGRAAGQHVRLRAARAPPRPPGGGGRLGPAVACGQGGRAGSATEACSARGARRPSRVSKPLADVAPALSNWAS